MKKTFDWIIERWLAGFVTASIFFTLNVYIDLPAESKSHFFSFKWLSELFQAQVQFSTVALIVIVVIVLSRIEKAFIRRRNMASRNSFKAPRNQYETYRRDVFGVNKTIWTWSYEWMAFEGVFAIVELKPICSRCGTPMDINEYSSLSSAECHKCRLEGKAYYSQVHEHIEDVRKEIVRRINDKEAKIN